MQQQQITSDNCIGNSCGTCLITSIISIMTFISALMFIHNTCYIPSYIPFFTDTCDITSGFSSDIHCITSTHDGGNDVVYYGAITIKLQNASDTFCTMVDFTVGRFYDHHACMITTNEKYKIGTFYDQLLFNHDTLWCFTYDPNATKISSGYYIFISICFISLIVGLFIILYFTFDTMVGCNKIRNINRWIFWKHPYVSLRVDEQIEQELQEL